MPRSRKRQDAENDLRREVQTLRRQLSRANREIARLQGVQEPQDEAEEPAAVQEGPRCPKCQAGPLASYTTPSGKVVRSCRACRKRIG